MNESTKNKDLSNWFSTYGLITAQRLLERFSIKLPQEDLFSALKTPGTFYYQLLLLPLYNVFNGIILQQAKDYQSYAQKLFVDYLISGENVKEEDSPGESTREQIEGERLTLIKMNEDLRQIEIKHEKIIAESQKILQKTASEWQKSMLNINKFLKKNEMMVHQSSITTLFATYNFQSSSWSKEELYKQIENKLNQALSQELVQLLNEEIMQISEIIIKIKERFDEFNEQVSDLSIVLKQQRKLFKSFIITVNELMKLLPESPLDDTQLRTNQQELNFDAELGEK